MSGNGKVVVLTGTSSGLGLETARLLTAQGYSVVGVARREVDAEDVGGAYCHHRYDFAEIDGIKSLADEIVAEHGWPYALINSAAIGTDGLLATMHNSDIERVIAVNLTAPIILTKYLSRGMIDAREGRIINISSVVASTGYRGLSAYASTKAGLEGFTRSLARDLGRRGITVNSVAPGFMPTAMTGSLDEDALATIARRSALGKLPSTSSVASTIAFLLGDAGSDISGSVLTVDAGNTA